MCLMAPAHVAEEYAMELLANGFPFVCFGLEVLSSSLTHSLGISVPPTFCVVVGA